MAKIILKCLVVPDIKDWEYLEILCPDKLPRKHSKSRRHLVFGHHHVSIVFNNVCYTPLGILLSDAILFSLSNFSILTKYLGIQVETPGFQGRHIVSILFNHIT